MRALIAVVAALALLGAAGGSLAACGGDDATIAPTTAAPTGATGPTDQQRPGAETQDGSGDGAEFDPEQDTEQNDLPPPPGSPAERFERHCEENPQACD